MHIAFLTPEYPHPRVLHAAGIGTSIKNLVVALVTKGVQVSVFVYGQMETAVFEEAGVTVHLVKSQKYKVLGWYLHRRFIQKYLNTHIVSEKIDLVEAPDWTGITAFMHLKAPLVIRFHGSDTYFCHLERRKQKQKNYWFEKLAMMQASAFVAPTVFAADVTKQLFGLARKNVKVVYNGLDLNAFKNDAPLLFEKGLILYVGTIIRKKGVFELPEIFNKVRKAFPETRLMLIGSDTADIQTQSSSTWELLKKEFEEEDLQQVSYLGKMPYASVQEHIRKANVCIFPSFAETFGMITIEAMALNKAVVSNGFGWSQELITDGESGFLVDPKAHDDFANKIIELLQDETLANTIGAAARKRVEAVFDIQKIAQENIDFYESVIGK
ncbi:Glycosyltransferase involved in cell wall bisynthesis [Flavobacterium succinicans]|uniref:Glycosyltransferase involved in cell wall bisynthesis n=1 Tax=Flavobacterium succinicans TaxID=29536 RepID=A0A1I4SHY1_9FLAO|nr:glycosyltransferase family 4 protein [Flavobacterium succinicans]SFM63930.1 Glycosyltransferase involved in cell wall bisynthesis [Flavobacterium succinicans]